MTPHTLTWAELKDGYAAGADEEVAATAASNVDARTVTLLGFSGKLASGKDTMAMAVMHVLGIDSEHWVQLSLADTLKTQINEIIEIVRAEDDVASAAQIGRASCRERV